MRREKKILRSAASVPRKSAQTTSAAARRPFPAWIVADENGVAFPAKTIVTPRVRDALVLRTVSTDKTRRAKHAADGRGAR